MTWYRLDENKEIHFIYNPIEWEAVLNDLPSRIVGSTEIGDMKVSTVFLGLDHGLRVGPPLVFETMIFGGPEDQEYQTRCCTYAEALEMHEQGIKHAKELLK